MASPQLKTRSWRPPFDADQDFVVARDFYLRGQQLAAGLPFDCRLVTTRRLRQLYEQRFLRLAGQGEGGSVSYSDGSFAGTPPAVPRRRRMSASSEPHS